MAKLIWVKPTIVKLTMAKLFIIVKLIMVELTIIKLNMAKKMMK
jgi:hypothetical protein